MTAAKGADVSTFHGHTTASLCMSEVKVNDVPREGGKPSLEWTRRQAMVDQGHWWLCGRSKDYFVHEHGSQLFAHEPNDPAVRCPEVTA